MAPPRSFDGQIQKFEPSTGDQFSAKELSRSYWIVTHKVLFRNIFIMLLVTLDIFFVGYSVYQFGSYFILGGPREDALVVAVAQRLRASTEERLRAGAPQDISFGPAQAFDGGNGTVDFVSEIQNQNTNWYARVTYNFELGSPDKTTPTSTTFVLPGDHKYLLSLGNKNVELLSQASLHVVDVAWQRVNPHQIPDPQDFIKTHSTFDVLNATFTPQGVIASSTVESNPGNQIAFEIVNQTAYNFYELPLQILLMRGGVLQAIEYATVKDFHTGEHRQMDVRNYMQGLTVDDVQVIPSVDVFDTAVYTTQ